ncbi:hypothetical protein CBR_g51563 [Chara braunii]|uniref:DUF659 domain-containing protein n=1 Tax=Chara braunii TaxID=69332 RepID=A0A388M929_CHABU|nr:hypothetical protein CBR_g51563 [Chara braunii]|eukprot:GBG90959.1 hypothetical protein CBR_g51563 [Chara braunii]
MKGQRRRPVAQETNKRGGEVGKSGEAIGESGSRGREGGGEESGSTRNGSRMGREVGGKSGEGSREVGIREERQEVGGGKSVGSRGREVRGGKSGWGGKSGVGKLGRAVGMGRDVGTGAGKSGYGSRWREVGTSGKGSRGRDDGGGESGSTRNGSRMESRMGREVGKSDGEINFEHPLNWRLPGIAVREPLLVPVRDLARGGRGPQRQDRAGQAAEGRRHGVGSSRGAGPSRGVGPHDEGSSGVHTEGRGDGAEGTLTRQFDPMGKRVCDPSGAAGPTRACREADGSSRAPQDEQQWWRSRMLQRARDEGIQVPADLEEGLAIAPVEGRQARHQVPHLTQTRLDEWVQHPIQYDLDMAYIRFFVGCGVPFNIARSEWYVALHDAYLSQFSGPYRPRQPQYEFLWTTLLSMLYAELDERLRYHRESWSEGVTSMTDGWSTQANRPLCNYLVAGRLGASLYRVEDMFGRERTGAGLCRRWRELILEIGAEHVVAICTDNAWGVEQLEKLVFCHWNLKLLKSSHTREGFIGAGLPGVGLTDVERRAEDFARYEPDEMAPGTYDPAEIEREADRLRRQPRGRRLVRAATALAHQIRHQGGEAVQGEDVIDDDVSWLTEPYRGDGFLEQENPVTVSPTGRVLPPRAADDCSGIPATTLAPEAGPTACVWTMQTTYWVAPMQTMRAREGIVQQGPFVRLPVRERQARLEPFELGRRHPPGTCTIFLPSVHGHRRQVRLAGGGDGGQPVAGGAAPREGGLDREELAHDLAAAGHSAEEIREALERYPGRDRRGTPQQGMHARQRLDVGHTRASPSLPLPPPDPSLALDIAGAGPHGAPVTDTQVAGGESSGVRECDSPGTGLRHPISHAGVIARTTMPLPPRDPSIVIEPLRPFVGRKRKAGGALGHEGGRAAGRGRGRGRPPRRGRGEGRGRARGGGASAQRTPAGGRGDHERAPPPASSTGEGEEGIAQCLAKRRRADALTTTAPTPASSSGSSTSASSSGSSTSASFSGSSTSASSGDLDFDGREEEEGPEGDAEVDEGEGDVSSA